MASPPPTPESPAFSIVFTSPEGENVVIHDFQPATTRTVLFQPSLPRPSLEFASRRGGRRLRSVRSDLSLRSLDAKREGDLAYTLVYQMEHMREEASSPDMDDVEDEAPRSVVSETTPTLVASILTWFKDLRLKLQAYGRPPGRA
ncbi:hypothetical protein BKA70DRAFT_1417557 [Coprinopsis sp. MPI-PUGE-AT-0042]|nr:hypothetical protein BKA70DRAFT_1417557 [Coprinopsis sp. MPI-PUGE-AT-0042]